jgi:hypothetical protein
MGVEIFKRIVWNGHSDPMNLILVRDQNVKERPLSAVQVWQIMSQALFLFIAIRSCFACCILLLKKCLSGIAPFSTSFGVSRGRPAREAAR